MKFSPFTLQHKEKDQTSKKLLCRLGIEKHLNKSHHSFPAVNSSGLALLALMNGGEIALADEPTGALIAKLFTKY